MLGFARLTLASSFACLRPWGRCVDKRKCEMWPYSWPDARAPVAAAIPEPSGQEPTRQPSIHERAPQPEVSPVLQEPALRILKPTLRTYQKNPQLASAPQLEASGSTPQRDGQPTTHRKAECSAAPSMARDAAMLAIAKSALATSSYA